MTARELLTGGAHLAALWAFAFAQPLLDLLGRNPDFFVARGNTGGDIILLSVGFTLLPPLLMLGLETGAAAFSGRAYRALHLGLVALMAAFFFVQLEKRVFTSPAALMIVLALVFGVLVAYGLRRLRFVRGLLDLLAVAPLLFLGSFLFFSDASELVLPQQDTGALGVPIQSDDPVVMLIFDELPTATLLNERGRIDHRRFPGFAELAATGTWYRNNTTMADITGRALPAIFTGSTPARDALPIASSQPNSIFTLLGGSYRLHVNEAVTQMCPASLCGEAERPGRLDRLEGLVSDLKYVEGRLVLPPAIANSLPNVSTTFGDFGNNDPDGASLGGEYVRDLFSPPDPEEFERFLRDIPASRKTMSMIHVELPHEPFRYLPDGRSYEPRSISNLNTDNAARWSVGSAGIASAQQRHYLQSGYADLLVRSMISRLRRSGIWREAMVIVTADHGISFEPGIPRRIARPRNLGGVANPPLFVKLPQQRRGRTSDALVRSVDVLPTIATVLGVELPFPTEGVPLSQRKDSGQVIVFNGKGEVIREPLRRLLRQRDAIVNRAEFRLGRDGLLSLGPAPELLGRLTSKPTEPAAGGREASVEDAETYQDVDLGAAELPAFVAGSLDGVQAGNVIAIAVNGRVAATCRAFLDQGRLRYGAVVPPSALREGRNTIDVYEVAGAVLRALGGT